MLVQFLLKNVLSFRNETILDLTSINAYKEHKTNLIDIGAKEKFLRVAAIYGANASGKSNLYLAMKYCQRIIVESFNNVAESKETAIKKYYFPFSLESNKENSEFQIVEIVGDYEYRYGFEYNSEYIENEWLYRKSIKTKRTSIIFERNKESVEFGATVRHYCEVYKDQIPAETLVLSFFNKLKLGSDIFKTVYSAILETLAVPTNFCEDTEILERSLPTVIEENKEKLVSFLKAIDTGIKDISYKSREKEIEFYTTHLGRDGKNYTLNLYNESEGTIKSIMIFIYAQIALRSNSSLFIDELNIKLHPLLLKFIVDLFYDNDSMAQLIYTTHDTTLLDKRFFRRDQIWFVQKDEFGYSELVALSDFKVRSDASFEKDYLAGVYGGIPLIKDFEMKEGD